MSELIVKLVIGQSISNDDIATELYDICDREHSSCNENCPVYRLNGNKVPDSVNDFKVNRGCDCFKNGYNMMDFIRKKVYHLS